MVLEDVDIRQPQLNHRFDWSFGRTQLVDSWHVHVARLRPPSSNGWQKGSPVRGAGYEPTIASSPIVEPSILTKARAL